VKELIRKMRAGDRRALSRLLSYVETPKKHSFELLEEIWPFTGKALSVGITGPAGAGKSSLIDQLIRLLREKGKKVGVIAVDPSSPFTGGAVFGDRIRMQRHTNDPEVFIRSVGNKGKSGGVSFSTRALMQLLDAFGTEVILVETVGAGQSEVDIVDLVNTTVLVLMPEVGDSIQTLKAGILEIADVFVINKKDKDGTIRLVQDIEGMLSMSPLQKSWKPPIILTNATTGEGVSHLWQEVERHSLEFQSKGIPKEELLNRRFHELAEIIDMRLSSIIVEKLKEDGELKKKLTENIAPNVYALADRFLHKIGMNEK